MADNATMKTVKRPACGGARRNATQDEGGRPAMALHVLRRVHHATLQQQGEHAGPLPGLDPVEADPSPNGNAREDLQEPDLGVLVPVADRPAVRRGESCSPTSTRP